MRAAHGDGGFVLGWFSKIVVVLAVFGVVAFEAVAIGVAHVQAQDLAAAAARAGSTQFQATKNVQQAYLAASAVATEKGGTIRPEEFEVEPGSNLVKVTVRREASSVMLYRFAATRKWLIVSESARARYVG